MRSKAKRLGLFTCGLLALVAISLVLSAPASAQQFLNTRSVGGVIVDAQGMLAKASPNEIEELRRLQAEVTSSIPREMANKVPLRKISLTQISRLLQEAVEAGRPVPSEVLCLGGLQDIHYVIGDPEQRDIFLVGPAEAWKSSPGGILVGATSGRAVMLLDDLIVALRSLSRPQPEVISCSINPRAETLPALQQFTRRMPRNMPAEAVAQEIERILGPQEVTVTGVPANSHYARVLVATDFRMKRIGLGLDRAPVADLPPFTVFVRAQAAGMMPRWWLVPEVPQLSHDPDGLVWELPPLKVNTITETQFIATRQQGVKASANVPGAERWAQVMTDKYEELAKADPIFDQLRNCMELAVAAAIIVSHKLPERTGADISFLMGQEGLQPAQVQPVRYVPTESVIVPAGRSAIVASGGVEINPWKIVAGAQQKAELRELRPQLSFPNSTGWWSN